MVQSAKKPRGGHQPPLALEMWSVVDKAVAQVPPTISSIDDRAMRLCMTLRTASNVVFYDLTETLLANSGLTGQELNVMLIANLHGELEFKRLASFGNLKKATASALVNSMVVRGLLQRRVPESDRRVTLLSLTPMGREAFNQAFAVYNEREQFWTAGLSAREADTLTALLKKLVNARINLSRLSEA